MEKQKQLSKSHNELYFNLKAMGFQEYLNFYASRHQQFRIHFNESMFVMKNPPAFHLMCHFLIDKCTGFGEKSVDNTLDRLKSCFPCRDKKQEADFKSIVQTYLISLKKDPDTQNFPWKLPIQSLLGSPGGEQFVQFFMSFSSYALVRQMPKNWSKLHSKTTFYRASTPDDLLPVLTENIKYFEEAREKRNHVFKEIDNMARYFKDQYKNLNDVAAYSEFEWSESAKAMTDRDFECNDESFKLISDFYNSKLNNFKKKVFEVSNLMSETSENCSMITSLLSPSNESIEKTVPYNLCGQDTSTLAEVLRGLSSFAKVQNSQLPSVRDEELTNFSEASSAKMIQAEKVNSELRVILDNLRTMSNEKSSSVGSHRAALLSDKRIKDRERIIRSYFPRCLPTVKFGPQYANLSKRKEIVPAAPKTKVLEHISAAIKQTTAEDSPVLDLGDCSFNFGRLSAVHYVAPHGVADDSILLSPTRGSASLLNLSSEDLPLVDLMCD